MRLLRTISNDAWDSDILTEVSRESLQEIGDYRGIILLNTWKVPFGEDRDLYNYFLNKSQDCGKRVVAVMPYDSNLPQGGRGIAGLVPSGHRNNSEFIKRDAWAISSDIDNYFRVQREF